MSRKLFIYNELEFRARLLSSKEIRIHVKGVFKYIKIGFKSSLFLSFGKLLLLILEVKDFSFLSCCCPNNPI